MNVIYELRRLASNIKALFIVFDVVNIIMYQFIGVFTCDQLSFCCYHGDIPPPVVKGSSAKEQYGMTDLSRSSWKDLSIGYDISVIPVMIKIYFNYEK